MIYTVTLNPAVDRELTVPGIALDVVLRATGTRVDIGGKGFNVSRMLIGLGVGNTAVALAAGGSGEFLRDGLEVLGVGTDFVWVAGETRTNVSVVSESEPHYLKVNEPGPVVGETAVEELLARVQRLAQAGDWWVLSGSLPPGAPLDVYARIIESVQGAGGKAILDTSGEALRIGCRAAPFMVKPNAEETAELTDLPVDSEERLTAAAEKICKIGPQNVLISLGKKGALLVTPGETYRAASPAVEEANPIGAGDSLVAGLVCCLDQGVAWTEALRFALACGAASASMPGTAVGTRERVMALMEGSI